MKDLLFILVVGILSLMVIVSVLLKRRVSFDELQSKVLNKQECL